MSDNSHIEWTDASWNPIRARYDPQPITAKDWKFGMVPRFGWQCQRVSPGCQNCYAEAINKRLGTGLGYDANGMAGSVPFLDEKTLMQPLSWRKPRKVFACSMTDIAGEWVPDEWLDRMFAVMALMAQHTYQLLTKRPGRLREYLSHPETPARIDLNTAAITANQPLPDMRAFLDHVRHDSTYRPEWPLPNVWIGTSVEDQQRADERIPELLATPAAVRFLSCEPLLGPVSLFENWECRACGPVQVPHYCDGRGTSYYRGHGLLDWVIVGGESGSGARPMDLAWARSLVAQCQAADVAVFVKQLGRNPLFPCFCGRTGTEAASHAFCQEPARRLRDRKGGDMAEWPEDLRVREWPEMAVGV